MKKPTVEDLDRIRKELWEMVTYFKSITWKERLLTNSEIDIYDHLNSCIDYCNDIIKLIPDLREGVIDDC